MTEQTSSEAMDRWRLAWREHPVWGELQTTANVMDEAEDDQPYGGHEDVKTRARWIQLRTLLAEALNFREEPQVRVTDLTLDDLAKAATAIRSHLPEGIDTIWSRPQNQPNKPAPITNLLRPYRAFAPTGAESFDVSMAGLREQQSDFLRKLQARVEVVVNDTNAMSQQLAGRIESYESTWEKQQARFDAQAEAALEDLKSHEVRGKKIVATVAHEATAGHYEVAATKSETTATRLRGGAIGMAAVGLVVIVAFTAWSMRQGDLTWQSGFNKLGVVLAFGAVTAYLGREAASAQQRADNAREVHLLVNVLEPFVADFGKNDDGLRQEVRKMAAVRIFGGLSTAPLTATDARRGSTQEATEDGK